MLDTGPVEQYIFLNNFKAEAYYSAKKELLKLVRSTTYPVSSPL